MRPRLPACWLINDPRSPLLSESRKASSTLSSSVVLESEWGFAPMMMLAEVFVFGLPLQTYGNCHSAAWWKRLKPRLRFFFLFPSPSELNLSSEDRSPDEEICFQFLGISSLALLRLRKRQVPAVALFFVASLPSDLQITRHQCCFFISVLA